MTGLKTQALKLKLRAKIRTGIHFGSGSVSVSRVSTSSFAKAPRRANSRGGYSQDHRWPRYTPRASLVLWRTKALACSIQELDRARPDI
jgi:hypothetical protein